MRKLQMCYGCKEWFNTTNEIMREHRMKCNTNFPMSGITETSGDIIAELFERLAMKRFNKYSETKTIEI